LSQPYFTTQTWHWSSVEKTLMIRLHNTNIYFRIEDICGGAGGGQWPGARGGRSAGPHRRQLRRRGRQQRCYPGWVLCPMVQPVVYKVLTFQWNCMWNKTNIKFFTIYM